VAAALAAAAAAGCSSRTWLSRGNHQPTHCRRLAAMEVLEVAVKALAARGGEVGLVAMVAASPC